jgi:very-short-patch-repair endonuclease
VIASDQLTALEFGRGAVAHHLATGRWQRMHRGVYLIGPAPPTATARARAAVLACGQGAVVSHRTAAELWGLIAPRGGDPHITVPGRSPRRRPGIRLHRVAELASFEVVVRDGLALTSVARTICDMAGARPVRDVEDVLTEARRQRFVTDRQLVSVIDRAPARRGSAVIRALLNSESETGYTRSNAERLMLKLIRAAGLARPRLNAPLLGYVVDFLWPSERLIVEVDGYMFHGHRAKFETDRRRDQQLIAAGYRVIRVTWRQLRDQPLSVIASLAQALALTP